MRAVIYLRVSTLDQVRKGGTHRDGFSIPAQREACRQRAMALGATVVREYVDRGESARSTARPALQRFLADLCEKKKFDYVIVHKIDRLARNLHDDVMIGLAIKKGGAQLVSVTENIDDTPSGTLLHGIMAAIAEFYSRNLAAEALKGATQKAKQGGTPYQAPTGYLNVTERINRREIRTVIYNPENFSLMTWAFERYATGDYSEKRLLEQLSLRGLRSQLRSRSSGKSISLSALDRILSNRYYLGYVTYCGIEYKGNHQPLVTPSVFAACQAVRASHHTSHNRQHKHYHYLTSLIVCARCKRRLCYCLARKKYHYFFCMNRKVTGCKQPYIPINLIEKAVVRELRLLQFTKLQRQQFSELIGKELDGDQHAAESDLQQQRKRLDRLKAEQENVLQAYYADLIMPDLLKSEQKRIIKEIEQADIVIVQAESRLKIVKKRRSKALSLAEGLEMGKAFKAANPIIRGHFCKALFSTMEVDDQIIGQSKLYWWQKEHSVQITKVNWHKPVNIHHITEAILALSLERNTDLEKEVDIPDQEEESNSPLAY